MRIGLKRGLTALIILSLIPSLAIARDGDCELRLMTRFKRAPSRGVAGVPSINLKVRVGHEDSLFFRGGDQNLTSVQVRAVSGSRPLVGGFFPAGNSGAMAMLASDAREPKLTIGDDSFAVQHGSSRGITTPIKATHLELKDGKHILRIASFALGNVRFLRDHVVADHGTWIEYGMKPAAINEQSELTGDGDLIAYRTSLSGKAEYSLRIHPLNGAVIEKQGNEWVIVGGHADEIQFEITPTTSEPPRVGVSAEKLIEPWHYAQMSSEEKQKLEYLFFEDGAVAGAHAYTTFFGRDPLITAMIAQDAFTPYALKILARAALDTLNAKGNIAHEPTQGERASYERMQKGEGHNGKYYDDTTIYDYAMIDTQFLLMPVMKLLLKKTSVAEVSQFLLENSRNTMGKTYGELLTMNKLRIIDQARGFAEAEMKRGGTTPAADNFKFLIHLLDGRTTGQWRDSNFGLAGGKYPYDVNTSLVPAALEAILDLQALRLPGWTKEEAATVRAYHTQWSVKPYRYFLVEIDNHTARTQADSYARTLGINVPVADPFKGKPLKFFAIALDANGKPVPVMHSDTAFSMLYTDPPAEYLPIMLQTYRLPYPYGLDAPAGMFIATAAYATPQVQTWFKMRAYHAGIWSMMQEMEARALTRQRARYDLNANLQGELQRTHFHVWRAISRNADWRPVELWSGRVENGVVLRAAFGTGKNIVAESCLDQFWSNTKIANFAPAGWEKIPAAALNQFMTWEGSAPLDRLPGI